MPPLEKRKDQLLKAQADIRAFTDTAVSHLDSLAAEYRKTNPSISSDFSQAAAKLRKSKDQMYKEFSSAKTTQQKSEILAKYFVYSRHIYSGTLSLSWHDIFAQPERLGGNMLWAVAEGALISCRQSTQGLASAKVALADKNGNVYGEAQLGSVASTKALDEYKNSKALLESKILEAQSLIRSGKNMEAMELMKLIAKKDGEITTRFMKHVSSRAESMAIERRNAGQSGIKSAYNFVFTDHPWAIDAAVLAGGLIFPVAAPASAGYFFGRGATEFALGAMEKNPERAFFGALMALTPAGRLSGVAGKVGQAAGSGLMTFAMLDGAKVTIDAAKYGWTKQDAEALVSNGIFLAAGYVLPRATSIVPVKKASEASQTSPSYARSKTDKTRQNPGKEKDALGRLLAKTLVDMDYYEREAKENEREAEKFSHDNLAVIFLERASKNYLKAHNYGKAMETLERALKIYEKAGRPKKIYKTIISMLVVAGKKGDEAAHSRLQKRARDFYDKSVKNIVEYGITGVADTYGENSRQMAALRRFIASNPEFFEKWKSDWLADFNHSGIFEDLYTHLPANLIKLAELETNRPGAALELYNRFGIRFFARYRIDDLVKQLDRKRDPNKPLLLAIYPAADSRGSFYRDRDIIHGLTKKTDVVITEASTTTEAARNIIRTNKDYGEISSLMFGGHGSVTGATLGHAAGGNLDVQQFIAGADISRYFIETPSVILVSCSTGAKGGLAEQASYKYKNATIYAPAIDTALEAIKYMGLSPEGTPLFTVEWVDKGVGKNYRSGRAR